LVLELKHALKFLELRRRSVQDKLDPNPQTCKAAHGIPWLMTRQYCVNLDPMGIADSVVYTSGLRNPLLDELI